MTTISQNEVLNQLALLKDKVADLFIVAKDQNIEGMAFKLRAVSALLGDCDELIFERYAVAEPTPGPKFNVHVQLTGEDGNAFAIIGKVRRAIKEAGATPEQLEEFTTQATSGDYMNVLRTASMTSTVASVLALLTTITPSGAGCSAATEERSSVR